MHLKKTNQIVMSIRKGCFYSPQALKLASVESQTQDVPLKLRRVSFNVREVKMMMLKMKMITMII